MTSTEKLGNQLAIWEPSKGSKQAFCLLLCIMSLVGKQEKHDDKDQALNITLRSEVQDPNQWSTIAFGSACQMWLSR